MSRNDAEFTIGANGSAFVSSMSDITTKAQGSLAKIGEAWMGVQGIAVGLRKAFEGLRAPITAFGELENVQEQLSVMMDSKTAAEQLTRTLQNLATNGVVSMQDLLAASRPLTNFMQEEEIEHWVARFADIAAASKVPAERFAAMAARLHDMGKAEFTELANAGIPIFEALGEVIGASREELIKMSAEGKISADEFLQAIELLTAEGGRFYQMNSRMSNTTLGSLATLAATWQELLAEVGRPFAEFLTPVVQQVIKLFDELKPVLSAAMDKLGEFLQTFITEGGMSSERAREMASSLLPMFESLLDVLAPIWKMQMQVADSLRGVLIPLLGALVPLLENVAVQLRVIGVVLELLAPLVELVLLPLEQQLEFFGELLSVCNLLPGALDGTSKGMDKIGSSASTMAKFLSGGVGALRDFLRLGRVLMGLRRPEQAAEDAAKDAELAEAVARAQVLAAEKVRAAQGKAAREAEKAAREAKEAAARRAKLYALDDADLRQDVLADASHASDVNRKIRLTMQADGISGEDELARELQRLRELLAPTDEELARYQSLLNLENKVLELRRAAAAEEEKRRKEAARAAAEEAARAAEARAEARKDYQRRRQERIDAEWEKNTSVEEQLRYYYGNGSVQMTPGEVSKERVLADMDYLAEEDPVKHAPLIEEMERWLDKVTALEARRDAEAEQAAQKAASARVDVVQSSLASVGGGGASIRIGDKQFREAQQQTKLLGSMDKYLEKIEKRLSPHAILA